LSLERRANTRSTMNSTKPNSVPPTPPAEFGGKNFVLRFMVIGLIITVIVALFFSAGGWFTPHALSPEVMIDTFEQVNGMHSGFRRNHAKGVCVSGYFESNGNGVALSRAVAFCPGRVPVIGRFALAGG